MRTHTECVPRTCASAGSNCGTIDDGCSGTLQCGQCSEPQTCGGGGTPNECGLQDCSPINCAAQGKNCGPIDNGCGASLSCGDCTFPDTCGGGGKENVCGCRDDSMIACDEKDCGTAIDQCGQEVSCGQCTAPDTCTSGVCDCEVDETLECAGKCGQIMTSCGPLDCGTCTAPKTCGGAGTANVCGEGTCIPDNVTPCQGKDCGNVANNCGELTSCGSCTAPDTCGGGGSANICGCTPDDIAACYNKDCGTVKNNCDLDVSCGSCTSPETCGGGGTNNVCGCTPDCTNKSCNQQTDGCGSICQPGSGCSPCTVHVDASTVALYTFEGTGKTVVDAVGQNPGQAEGAVARVAGKAGCGNAVYFDRPTADRPTTNYIEVPDSPSWDLQSGSIDFWVRFDAVSYLASYRGMLGRDAVFTPQAGHLTFYRACDGSIVFRIQDLLDVYYVECSAPVAEGVWHHVGGNFGAAGMQLFVNGQLATRTDSATHYISGECKDDPVALCGTGGTLGIAGADEPWGFGLAAIRSDPGVITPTWDALGGTIDSIRISNAPRDFAAMVP